MFHFLRNQQNSLMGYMRLRSFFNDIRESLDHWAMLSEDLEPKGGILSLRWEIQRYLWTMEKCSSGVEEIMLWKDGDIGRRGGSWEEVAV